MVNEHGVADVYGERGKLFRIASQHGAGPFHEIRKIPSAQAFAPRGSLGTGLLLELPDFALQSLPAYLRIDHYIVTLQCTLVLTKGTDRKGGARPTLIRGEKSVASSLATCLDRFISHPDLERHDATAENAHDPADGTTKGECTLSVGDLGIPIHELRKAQATQRGRHEVGQQVGSRLTLHLSNESDILTLGCFNNREFLDVDIVLFGEPESRLAPLARLGPRDAGRRSRIDLPAIRLPVGKLRHMNNEAARGTVDFHVRTTDTELSDSPVEAVAELLEKSRKPTRW